MFRSRRFAVAAMVGSLALAGGCSMFSHDTSPAAAAPPAPAPRQTAQAPAQSAPPSAVGIVDTLRRPGRVNLIQHTFIEDGADRDVAVDPSGRFIAYASTRDSDHPAIFLQRTDGLAVTQLTDGSGDDASPSFSPDGKQIAFCSTRTGKWDVFVMDRDGRNVTQITTGPAQCVHPSFSPDGTRLVYSCLGPRSGQWELWTVMLSNNQKQMIGYGLFPTWSPARDRDLIAFQRPRARGSRHYSLWTLDVVDGEARHVTEIAASVNSALVSPSWSPDGKRLAFCTIIDTPGADDARLTRQDVWTICADGTGRQRITDGTGLSATPAWGPDNRIYFISDRGGPECVWSVAAGSVPTVPVAAAMPDKSASPMTRQPQSGQPMPTAAAEPKEMGR